MDAAKQAIEPQFLSQALALGTTLRIGQVNRTDHEGIIREIGRYEINVETRGGIITILKQDIASLSSPVPLVTSPAPDAAAAAGAPTGTDAAPAKPNIQHEFLDKAIRERHHLTIFLLNGQRIKATVEAYDNFTLLIREGERQHLYYKHAISTINR
jgi:host factor-I protein